MMVFLSKIDIKAIPGWSCVEQMIGARLTVNMGILQGTRRRGFVNTLYPLIPEHSQG